MFGIGLSSLATYLAAMFDFLPKRYSFALLGFLATTLTVALQSNLSFAIVYMVETENNANSITRRSDECNENRKNISLSQQTKVGADLLAWGPDIQGIVIGTQFAGVIISSIPGGRLAEIYGGKRTMIISLFVASVFTALLPLVAKLSVYIFMICRFMVGLGTGPTFSILLFMISRWIPGPEQTFSSSFILAGFGSGSFISYLTAGALCSSDFLGGWPAVFYVGATSGVVWCVLCCFVLFDSPAEHPTIKSEELEYIVKYQARKTKQIESIPWMSITTSIPFWALLIGTFGQYWILAFFLTSQSLYLGTVLNLESAENGLLSCLPHLIRAVVACVCGVIIDIGMRRKKVPVAFIRKGATLLNSATASLGFLGIIFSGCDPTANTIFFIIGSCLGDFCTFGVCLAAIDMAPNLGGTLTGIISSICYIPYIALPALIGIITKHEISISQWSYIYYGTIGIIIITTLIYIAFGTSDPQPWGIDTSSDASVSKENPQKGDELNNTCTFIVYDETICESIHM